MRSWLIKTPALFLLAALASTLTLRPSHAQESPPSSLKLRALESDAQASQFAEELIAEYRKLQDERAGSGQPATERPEVYVFHVGETVPFRLRNVLVRLEHADFKVTIDVVKKHELLARVREEEKNEASDLNVLKYSQNLTEEEKEIYVPLVKKERKKLLSRVKGYINDFFGVPNGFTFWMKFNRSAQERKNDAKAALIPTALSGLTAAATVYSISPLAQSEMHLMPAMLTSMAWTFFNIYTSRAFTEWVSQGKNVHKKGKQEWKIDRMGFGLRLGLTVRNMLMTSSVLAAALGIDQVLSITNVGALAASSYLAVSTRFWFEDWLMHRQATVLTDGSVVVEEGQHSPKKTTTYRGIFESLNSLVQSLSLMNFEPARLLVSASGLFSTLRVVYGQRFHVTDHARFFVDRVFKKSQAASQCTTLLVFDPSVPRQSVNPD